jgi:hypothetical protein
LFDFSELEAIITGKSRHEEGASAEKNPGISLGNSRIEAACWRNFNCMGKFFFISPS